MKARQAYIENKDFPLQAKLEKRMRELMKEAGDPGDTQEIIDYRTARRPKN